jgi:hypothetical protein
MAHSEGQIKAVPIIEDGIVPLDKLEAYIQGVYQLFAANQLQAAIWGHAGDGNLHMQPFLDLSQIGDRQKAFRLIDEYYKLVISLGGSTSGEHGDGRLRAPYLKQLYGEQAYEVFTKVKQIFDPYGTMNPGVKIGVTLDDIKPLVRTSYSMDHLYDNMMWFLRVLRQLWARPQNPTQKRMAFLTTFREVIYGDAPIGPSLTMAWCGWVC